MEVRRTVIVVALALLDGCGLVDGDGGSAYCVDLADGEAVFVERTRTEVTDPESHGVTV